MATKLLETPTGKDGEAGAMLILANVAPVTVSEAEFEVTPPNEADTLVDPAETPVATPFDMDAIDVSAIDQVTALETSAVELSA